MGRHKKYIEAQVNQTEEGSTKMEPYLVFLATCEETNTIRLILNSSKTSLATRRVMAHSLTPAPPPATVPISTASRNKSQCPSLGFQRVWLCHQGCDGDLDYKLAHRRAVTLGIAGAVLGLNVSYRSVSAAARRPPPPSPEERRDPNLSGVQVKVLASKKRKEAMKEAVGKLRERGKPVDGPTGSE